MPSSTPFWAETIRWLGVCDYSQTLKAMEAHRSAMLNAQAEGEIWLVEHNPVVTLGRHANAEDVDSTRLAHLNRPPLVVRTSRGGKATFHGPGQLVIYPIVRVGKVAEFLEWIGMRLVELLADHGINDARWQLDPAGVWIGSRKIAACGIHLSRGISIHGFALNVTRSEAWDALVPCGLVGMTPLSMDELCEHTPSVMALACGLQAKLLPFFSKSGQDALRL